MKIVKDKGIIMVGERIWMHNVAQIGDDHKTISILPGLTLNMFGGWILTLSFLNWNLNIAVKDDPSNKLE